MPTSTDPLPSASQIITSLVNQIKSLPPPCPTTPLPSNPLKYISHSGHQLFVTLHYFLPSTLLAALDLLDKSLVTRYTTDCGKSAYYVNSTQPLPEGEPESDESVYEVRTKTWSCSCEGFSFAAFGGLEVEKGDEDEDGEEDGNGDGDGEEGNGGVGEWEVWRWGGEIRGGGSPPVCKHLVACVLVDQCPELLGGYVVEERVDLDEFIEMAAFGTGIGE